jgi:acetoacetate decarboxylase
MSSDSPAPKVILYVGSDAQVRYADTTFQDVPEVGGSIPINFKGADGLEMFHDYHVTDVQTLATVDELFQDITDNKLLSAEDAAMEKDTLSRAMDEGLVTKNPSACVLVTMTP